MNTINIITTNMRNSFDNANEAYEELLDEVVINGMGL